MRSRVLREEVITTNVLKAARIQAGLSLRQLSEKSGVAIDTLSRLENNQRKPQVGTLNKIAAALAIPVAELAEDLLKEEVVDESVATEEKVEVTVMWRDNEDRVKGEVLRFRGEELDAYEQGGVTWTLYEVPDGYRVHIEDFNDDTADLLPRATWGNADYITYTAEELVQEFPAFGEAVGIYPVRDLD
jgi:transcriptional regulator with XRE-family HTH domain